jgi:hypothetical protein
VCTAKPLPAVAAKGCAGAAAQKRSSEAAVAGGGTAENSAKRLKAAAVGPEASAAMVRICTMAGADFELPLPEAASVADLRAAIAGRLNVDALSFDLFVAGDEDPLVSSEYVLSIVGPPPISAPIFMLQRLHIALTHVSDFDTNGYFHWKGTKGNTQPWENPQASAAVTTATSSKGWPGYAAHRVVQGRECDGNNNSTDDSQPCTGQWMSVDLHSDALEVNHYCLRHGNSHRNCMLRSWELQGCNGDDGDWVTLSEHKNDRALADEAFSTAGWAVEGGRGSFSQFRVLMTGPNSSMNNYLACAGLELYGTMLAGARGEARSEQQQAHHGLS